MLHIICYGIHGTTIATVLEGALAKPVEDVYNDFVASYEEQLGPCPKEATSSRSKWAKWWKAHVSVLHDLCVKYDVDPTSPTCETRCFIEYLKRDFGLQERTYDEIHTRE